MVVALIKLDRLVGAKKKMDHGVCFLTDLGSRRKEKCAPMLRYQSKQKETAYRGADMTAPEVSSRIQLLKQRNSPCPAAFTAEFNKTGDSSFSTALKAARFCGTWEEVEMVIRVTHGI